MRASKKFDENVSVTNCTITESVSHLLSGLNVSTAADVAIFSLGISMK